MNWSIVKSGSLGAASLLAAALLAGPASADGLPGRGRIASPVPTAACTVAANVGYTTDYVFRGVSQTGEEAAVQGGVDFTCGRFYVGTWGSSINFGNGTEIDVYGGFKTTTGPINWDLGFIYYAYPGAPGAADLDYVELKVNASGDIWKGGTLGGTVFYSPEFTANTGEAWTFEGTFAQALPKVSIFTPTFSAAVGHISFQDDHPFAGDLSYTYWNVGLSLGFLEKWSLDLRYWDTTGDSSDGDGCTFFGSCDGRFVGTIKYTF
jgi:uncharacterized protein (TIGR02001 family)